MQLWRHKYFIVICFSPNLIMKLFKLQFSITKLRNYFKLFQMCFEITYKNRNDFEI